MTIARLIDIERIKIFLPMNTSKHNEILDNNCKIIHPYP